ncbi:GntR family transcriptional regulator [Dichotomicrobium thermohalophilum]|uniref:DNA-binding GntR family transcriptional regulator n=1 Tax=Dichotomicrobium thermohalophilum TaxID=933063 RepID=A0A397PKI6_9HYPH|nr:GntR family transcriptional regulator [Dichotomicrobium thermohalophilum]RIA47667.1 DNA-binding GntR family transcriptional regulator [Dichotomicrobium thermohalophilum]
MSETEGAVSGPSTEGATLTEVAYREIEERIVTLRLLPGEVLSEARLVSTLGIGRTPIREALQRLAREGLVVIMPRRGVVVSEINVKKQLELLLVRRELERLMARLAARRATNEEREHFARIAADMRESADANDDVMFMRLDGELNHLLSETCRNAYAQGAMSLMQGLSRRFWYVHYKQVLDLPKCASLHADLADAIASADEEAAALASDRLIDYLETFTRASLDAPPQIQGAKVSPS